MSAFPVTRVVPEQAVRVTSPAPRDLWREVLAADPNALVFHSPTWLDFVCSAASYEDASRLYELPDGRRLVLPMVRQRRLPGPLANEASFPPAWGIGGMVALGGIRPADAAAVFFDLAGRNVIRTTLRPGPRDAEAWDAARPSNAVVVPRLAHILSLEGGFERVWSERLTAGARRSVKKAERSGVTVESDTSERLLSIFFDLFSRSLDRWAAQQHEPRALARLRGYHRDPPKKFQLMARTFGEAFRVWVALVKGRPAAAILTLRGANGDAHYMRGVMDKSIAGPTHANYLLQRFAIEEACAQGCRWYDMGESGTSNSLAHFKAKFGARPYPHADFHLERLPITAMDQRARGVVKRIIGFRD
jgi:Acetyltransferase (GNAT) domain